MVTVRNLSAIFPYIMTSERRAVAGSEHMN